MMTLVVGGSASGKSEYAEGLILSAAGWPRVYIATMQPFDEECFRRIEKHRLMRAGKSFETVECYTGLASVTMPENSAVLLECMSNLCANEMYSPQGSGENAQKAVLEGVERLRRQCRDLVIVSNEVFSGGSRYQGDTLRYLELLGRVNCALAAMADNVCEVVYGVPVYYKGGEPN
ncbi:bifunctional adenosylcobinamide kinase/adenosylcobinamide-phosphate guanylyltransferase [uncultured Dysosmobacter sp.]|uniref:bifunctional adenosylcobinamide kinase/adenosylcobinamide-phosphate guanylyltransferase n=1 Tax=uncultured Dysosmobacter sp. TaxID=2591384 RepID=UPI002632E9EB|nr:bifunctional adenosylcobinamide kinase/adenosylcobinamide-phosphate guanylyltransferase [uncultured Dysosmobacter sp.]